MSSSTWGPVTAVSCCARRASAAASLVIGIDPVQDAMADVARRASAKPSRGGVPNALFLVASAEALPAALSLAGVRW